MPFLNRLADYLIKNKLLTSNTKVILPNKRAGLFLKKELLTLLKSPTFLPSFLSIEEFVQSLSELEPLDNIHLQFELYKSYKEVVSASEQDSFEKFIQWAPVVLQDFNEIDSYVVDADKIFTNLSDLKRIESWSPNDNSSLSQSYLNFFKTLNVLYKSFYNNLLEKNKAYQGLMYREALKNISLFASNFKGKLIFAGFNALNKAEELIIQELLEHNKANIFWDTDKTLLDNKHPATKFISSYKSSWPYYNSNPFTWVSDDFSKSKKIVYVGATKQISQLKAAGNLLNKISENDTDFTNTALVLGDENLLAPALESLPKVVNKANITMGYALQNTPIGSLFLDLFKANLNTIKLKKTDVLYYKDVEKILNHPNLSRILNSNTGLSDKLLAYIYKNNIYYVDFKKLKLELNFPFSEVDFIFNPTGNNIDLFLTNSLKLIKILIDDSSISALEKEYLYRFYTLFNSLQELEKDYKFIKDLKTLEHFFKNLLQQEKLFFKGEPLNGLQIMGMLETRTLDFKNLIITSVNEGIIPANKDSKSFLPFAIKQAYKLPTYIDKEAIFSYHFFRLISRAESIYLIYNTEVDDFGASEKSRFLTQIELLKPKEIKRYKSISKVSSNPIKPREVVVTDKIKMRLKELAQRGLSPTAVASYIRNPLEFYYKYILNIKDTPTIDETIAFNTFGTVIHDTLHDLYEPFLKTFLTIENLENIAKKELDVLNINFKKMYSGGDIKTGKNKLFYEMAKNYIHKLVTHEKQLIKKGHSLKIIALETKLEGLIEIPEVQYPIKIKGTADRIDLLDGKMRVIDYKTGNVTDSHLKIVDSDTFLENPDNNIAFQLGMYAFMYAKMKNYNQDFEAGVISFKKPSNYVLKVKFDNTDFNISKERLKEFETTFYKVLQTIFNTEKFIEKI